jgi:hypothetical protein
VCCRLVCLSVLRYVSCCTQCKHGMQMTVGDPGTSGDENTFTKLTLNKEYGTQMTADTPGEIIIT